MRILVSGYHNPHYVTITEYIERAMRSTGHELITFNDRDHVFPGRLRKKFNFLQKLSVASINRALVKLAKQARPDVVLVTGGHRITANALRSMSKLKAQLALWTTDAPRASDMMFATGPLYNHLFCHGTEYMDIFHQMGLPHAEWLPMACDPEIHRCVEVSGEEKLKFGGGVVFVGSYYPQRSEMLQAVLRHRPAIWGPGWDALSHGSPLRPLIRAAHTTPETWVRLYSANKIVLSVHYRDPQRRFPVHQVSPRVFEAMACGAFVLTDRQKDVLALFKDGEHLVTFYDEVDLDRKIAFYMEHADERRRIAAAGRRKVLEHHTYGCRIHRLLARMEAMDSPPSPSPLSTSPTPDQRIAA